jgi:hypothetical protein
MYINQFHVDEVSSASLHNLHTRGGFPILIVFLLCYRLFVMYDINDRHFAGI